MHLRKITVIMLPNRSVFNFGGDVHLFVQVFLFRAIYIQISVLLFHVIVYSVCFFVIIM